MTACDLRYGERHPDRQDAVVLRGMAVERRSRPARLRSEWVSPLSNERAGDKGCPLVRQGGERLSACATKATQPFERQLSLLTRSVTRPSLGPRARARRSSLTSPAQVVEGDALGEGSRLGKPGNRRNQHRLLVRRTKRGSTRIPTLARGTGNASEKEGGCGLRPFEDLESSGRSARTSEMQLQKSSEAASGLE